MVYLPLKTQAFGLGNQEPDEKEHGKAAAAEEEVCPIARLPHRFEHMGNRLSHHKVEEPLRGSGYGDVHGSKASSRDLRHNNPAARSPAKLKESSEKVNACQGKVADRGDRRVWDLSAWGRRVEADIETNDAHCEGLGD